MQKTYLFVPFEFKDKAKKLNAKWDNNIKKWFVYHDNVNYQELVDTFHNENFYSNFYGTHIKNVLKTIKEIEDEKEKDMITFKKALENHLASGGIDDDDFRKTYSVRRHE